MSERTRYLRYFGAYPQIPPRDLERFTTVDHHDRVAFVALLGDDIVAVGRYERIDGGRPAEVAFVVEDAHQGRGLGSILLEHLAAAAQERGIERFVAEVLAENAAMVGVFRAAGYQVTREIEEGVFHLEFDIDPTEESVAVARSREQAAEARSVHNLLHPRSVALIGASTDPDEDRATRCSATCCAADFAGPVFPVNAEHRAVRGVRAYPSVLDIPDPVDLAVVAVPAAHMDEVMDACLAKGVKALVVISSGFGETGPAGEGAERRLVEEARAHGMRVVGPNALGRGQHRSGRPAQRHARARAARPRPHRLLLPVRRAGHRDPRRRRHPRARACRRSSPPATARTSPATTCCSTGRPTRRPMSCCCTWSRSATRASSPGSHAGSAARSRSSR